MRVSQVVPCGLRCGLGFGSLAVVDAQLVTARDKRGLVRIRPVAEQRQLKLALRCSGSRLLSVGIQQVCVLLALGGCECEDTARASWLLFSNSSFHNAIRLLVAVGGHDEGALAG